jgi:hypothetical protein
MNTIIKYDIVEGNLDTLPDEVNLRIKDGWRPQGGVVCCFAPTIGTLLAFQAMILEVEKVE